LQSKIYFFLQAKLNFINLRINTHTHTHQVIDEEGTQAKSAQVGEVFIKELLKLREEFEVVGDVRGKGLMLGVELVKSKVQYIGIAAGCIHQSSPALDYQPPSQLQ